MQLWNIYSKEELKARLEEKQETYLTISFYKYSKILNPEVFRDHLYQLLTTAEAVGRIYVANEGINAQIALPQQQLSNLEAALNTIVFLKDVRLNIAVDESEAAHAFLKLKIKVRDKILADGLHDDSFDVTNIGKHLNAKEFNDLTNDPETILIDFRNHYESEVGHFKGAILPDVDTFRESLPIIEEKYLKGNEDKNIVMYCTGGIRCEKASAYFKHKGYANVNQLEGGIIKYANDCKTAEIENKFIGKNFVFDERRGERITEDVVSSCHQCGAACDNHTNCANEACHLLFIQCSECAAKHQDTCSSECQTIFNLPLEEQKELRKGKEISNKIFKKGRSEKLFFKENNKKPLN